MSDVKQVFRLPRGKRTGVFKWRIDGPACVVAKGFCPEFPEYFFSIKEEAGNVDVQLMHIIWDKKPPPPAEAPFANERLVIDNQGDQFPPKTPHIGDLGTRSCIMSFCSKGDYTLEVTVIWRDTSDGTIHKDTKTKTISSKDKCP